VAALARAPVAPPGAAYRVRLAGRVADLPLDDWSRVREVDPSLFLDPRFLLTVERAFPEARCLHALVDDADGRPRAWASLCVFPVDLGTLAGAGARAVLERLRAVAPRAGRLRALFVGLPVSLGQSHLAIAPEADPVAVLAALDRACARLAAREHVSLIVWKEFDPAAAARLAPLLARGYRRAETPAMHELAARFADFGDYRAALTSHYRSDVRRSERKFRASGLRVVQLHDAAAIERAYTPDVHRLYEAVVARSAVKLELLPIEFFRQLVRQLPGLVTLTAIHDRDRIVAFNWGLLDGPLHHFLFCGLDYAIARDADLYFNLMYHQLDDALRLRPERIEVGQTADAFKARLGCRSTPRFVYVKPCRPLARAALRLAFGQLFPRRPRPPAHAVFREPAT
jgi:predicted N-acyltransferase